MMALLVYSTPAAPMALYQGGIIKPNSVSMAAPKKRVSTGFRVMASSDGRVTEVNSTTFWPTVEASGSKIIVLDMYTQWCGPCKVIGPKFRDLSEKYEDVVFLKLDCNQENRALAKELGLKVLPTFKIFKDGKVVKEVTGAKIDTLIAAIDTARSTSSH